MKARKAVPVIVIQTSGFAFESFRKELSLGARFVEGRDFLLFPHFSGVEQSIVEGEKQLLITGSFYGDQEMADTFVRKMKAKNPNLKAASCSSIYVTEREPYDFVIEKGDRGDFCAHLIREMKIFLAVRNFPVEDV